MYIAKKAMEQEDKTVKKKKKSMSQNYSYNVILFNQMHTTF